jgi:hypothetical protein
MCQSKSQAMAQSPPTGFQMWPILPVFPCPPAMDGWMFGVCASITSVLDGISAPFVASQGNLQVQGRWGQGATYVLTMTARETDLHTHTQKVCVRVPSCCCSCVSVYRELSTCPCPAEEGLEMCQHFPMIALVPLVVAESQATSEAAAHGRQSKRAWQARTDGKKGVAESRFLSVLNSNIRCHSTQDTDNTSTCRLPLAGRACLPSARRRGEGAE